MAYTGTNIIEMAQRLLVDMDDDAYGNDMLSYLNEGCRRFANETHCCQAVVNVSVSGQSVTFSDIVAAINGAYGASAEAVLFIGKVIPNTGTYWTPLPKAPVSEMKAHLSDATTTPTRYSVFAEAIYFDTEPGVTLNFTATIYCSYSPVDLSAVGDSLLIPDEWAQAIVKYIVFCCHMADRDAGLGNGAYQEFDAIKQAAANLFISQIEKIPGVV